MVVAPVSHHRPRGKLGGNVEGRLNEARLKRTRPRGVHQADAAVEVSRRAADELYQ